MGKNPVTAPEFAHEGVGVLQPDGALCGLADVGNDVLRADRIVTNQFSDRRSAGGLRVEENPGSLAFKEGDAPAIGMNIGRPAACLKTGERKADVGRYIAVHTEKLAHGLLPFALEWRPFADLDLNFDDVLVTPQAEIDALIGF